MKQKPSAAKHFPDAVLIDRIRKAAAPKPCVLPVHQPEFLQCGTAIHQFANAAGSRLPLPSALLPPV